jgi:hypothetical protein
MTGLTVQLTGHDLKKQSQFAAAQVGAKSFVKGGYDKKTASGGKKNRANQSQFLYRQRGSTFIIISMPDARCSSGIEKQESRIEKRNYD